MTDDPIFKDSNKNGKLDVKEIIEALKNPATRDEAKDIFEGLDQISDFFAKTAKQYEAKNPGQSVWKDPNKIDGFKEFYPQLKEMLEVAADADKATFPKGVTLSPTDALELMAHFSNKMPAKRER